MVRFGPFQIDPRTWTLTRAGAEVPLSPRLVQLLAHIVSRSGAIVTKEELLERFWPGTFVTENTLTRAVADIRKALGETPGRPGVIQTMARRGYRYAGTDDDAAGNDPLRAWVAGRLALESLDPSRLETAAAAFATATTAMPDYAPAHVGMANVWLLRHELSRVENAPDQTALRRAVETAQAAAALDTHLAEAWAVLGHALALAGRADEGRAAARRAVTLEPTNWRHHYRLALAGWGEERLRSAARAVELVPSCAPAQLLAAMVFVARGAWSVATACVASGVAHQDLQPDTAPLRSAGLHWMRGLVLSAQDESSEALAAFDREIGAGAPTPYSREFGWHSAVAAGFLHLDAGRRRDAADCFARANALVPRAGRAVLGACLSGQGETAAVERVVAELQSGGKAVEAALVEAAWRAWTGARAEAGARLLALVSSAPPGHTGWSLGADPIWRPLAGDPAFAAAVAAVAARAV